MRGTAGIRCTQFLRKCTLTQSGVTYAITKLSFHVVTQEFDWNKEPSIHLSGIQRRTKDCYAKCSLRASSMSIVQNLSEVRDLRNHHRPPETESILTGFQLVSMFIRISGAQYWGEINNIWFIQYVGICHHKWTCTLIYWGFQQPLWGLKCAEIIMPSV